MAIIKELNKKNNQNNENNNNNNTNKYDNNIEKKLIITKKYL